jgi:hypothetical protein
MKKSTSSRFLLQMTMACICWISFSLPARAINSPPPKDMAEARQWFEKGLEAAGAHDIKFVDRPDQYLNITFNDGKGHDVALVPAFVNNVVFGVDKKTSAWVVYYAEEGSEGADQDTTVAEDRREDAERFCQGLLFIVRQAQKDWDTYAKLTKAEFKPKADAWRAKTVKPELSPDAVPHKAQAEAADRDKDVYRALAEYKLALKADPLWPVGQYRAAELAAEIGMFRLAVLRMQSYLMLIPDAPDAQRGQGEIKDWQDQAVHL